MRLQDLKRLDALNNHISRGGFPDVGRAHAKARFRFTIGQAVYENGKIQPWRENLGHDLLVAQYRARAMFHLWVTPGASGT